MNANIHAETAKKTAQMIFFALACGFGIAQARYTLPSRCTNFTGRPTHEQVGMQE